MINFQLIYLALTSFSLGIFAKYADLFNEHGLKQPFKNCSFICGLLWGASGVGMIYFSPEAGLTYIAHVLYWFHRVKLEYTNHAIAGVMMILAGYYFQGQFMAQHATDLILVYLAYTLTGYTQKYFKEHYPASKFFWRMRLRIYLIPVIYAYFTQTVDPIIATGFGMLACEIITLSYRQYALDKAYAA